MLNKTQASQAFEFRPTHRLGVYFEQLWHHLISSNHQFQLLHKNRQVIIDKHTYGEFDSIIYDVLAKETNHCELTVKLYLKVGKGDTLTDWVGPNLKDRFDVKLKRLFKHQLQLSDNPRIKDWLQDNKIVIDAKKLLTKGRLFYPYQDYLASQFNFPHQVNPEHCKGFWLTYSQLSKVLFETEYQWYQLPRLYWLSEIESLDSELLPIDSNYENFNLQKIVALRNGKEVMRGFVVTDEWLHKAEQRILD